MEPYYEAHLFVAVIRVLLHQKRTQPTVENVSSALNLSVEGVLATCRSLERLGIIEISEDPFSIKLSIANHLEIEKLPREEEEDTLSRELEEFKAKKKDMDKQVAAIQANLKKKKQDMRNDMEEKLRKEMEKMKKGT